MTEASVPTPTAVKLSASDLKILGRHFIDGHGRIIHLRGANVGGSSKVPADPKPLIHDHASASYVNRPFPISEAPEHWRRLKSWGLNFVRITVTWDAIEHTGPGQYDEEYLKYLRALVGSMQEHGLVCYIAMHQDVWSRYSGGSGAPGWTLTKAGFDLSEHGDKLVKSGAAFLDGIKGGRLEGERGLWPTGYQKLAAASMNTFFWGGETFAPKLQVDTPKGKQNIQKFLQEHFLMATEKVVQAVGDLDTVLGFEMLNEPHPGYIGLASIHEWNYNTDLHLGEFPSPLQSFSMGAGHPTPRVPIYTRSFPFPTKVNRYITANESSTRAWTIPCPWQEAGAWRWSDDKKKPIALQEDYFAKDARGKKVNFYDDFFWPFVKRWNQTVERAGGKAKMKMVEVVPNEFAPVWPKDAQFDGLVYAPHWYDLNALFKKEMGFMTVNVQGLSRGMFILKALYWGEKGVKKNYKLQIKNIVDTARKFVGEVPVVFGECGVPMDINQEEALRTGDWTYQERMMDAMISAFESSQVGFNLWTYNPANKDSTGDDWNAENFSWFSDENRQKAIRANNASDSDRDAGGRLLSAVVRPYAMATAGTPTSQTFDRKSSVFSYRFRSTTNIVQDTEAYHPKDAEVTEIFLPNKLYKSMDDIGFFISAGGKIQFDLDHSRAFIWFVDKPSYGPKEKPERSRRLDVWSKASSARAEREEQPGVWAWLVGSVIVLILAFFAWKAQQHQWRQDARKGVIPYWF